MINIPDHCKFLLHSPNNLSQHGQALLARRLLFFGDPSAEYPRMAALRLDIQSPRTILSVTGNENIYSNLF